MEEGEKEEKAEKEEEKYMEEEVGALGRGRQ